ncbi:unnamed protein product [Hymenolepis diminuta]|uniref:Uncharacterized protein n=1 Tax=Hymenolepis diminuta TaxID=6216 RepID=A0A564YQ50_HYMDI|nr:unnamed protein product [Hymenolepis diminuta]
MDSNCLTGGPNKAPCVRNDCESHIGARTRDLRKRIQQEVENELSQKVKVVEPINYPSISMANFHNNSAPSRKSSDNLAVAKLLNEQPVTFWTDNYAAITGITQRFSGVKPFRRSNNFSCPIEYRMGGPQHYEMEGYTPLQRHSTRKD